MTYLAYKYYADDRRLSVTTYMWRFWNYFYSRVHVIGFDHSVGFFYLFILRSLVTAFSILAWYSKQAYLFLFQPITSVLEEKIIKNDSRNQLPEFGNKASCRNVMLVCLYIYIYIYIYCVYMCMCVYIYCVHVYIYILCVYVCVCVCIYIW